MTNILVTTTTEVLEKHVVQSIDNKYYFNGVGTNFYTNNPCFHGHKVSSKSPSRSPQCLRIKQVMDDTLQGLCRDFPGILEAPQLWIVISKYWNQHFIHNVMKTYLPSRVWICKALYHETKEEKIPSYDCFFENNVLRVTSWIFFTKGESSSEVAMQLCRGCKMFDMHDLGRYKRYSIKSCLWSYSWRNWGRKPTLTLLSLYVSMGYFLNICGGNKAHIVVHVSIYNLFSLVYIGFLVFTTTLAMCMFLPF